MKSLFISLHGYINFVIGTLTILSPFIFSFDGTNIETIITITIGFTIIGTTAISDYKFCLYPILSIKQNMFISLWLGAFLAFSPWLYNYYDLIYLPQLLPGILIAANSVTVYFITSSNLGFNKNYLQKITYRL